MFNPRILLVIANGAWQSVGNIVVASPKGSGNPLEYRRCERSAAIQGTGYSLDCRTLWARIPDD